MPPCPSAALRLGAPTPPIRPSGKRARARVCVYYIHAVHKQMQIYKYDTPFPSASWTAWTTPGSTTSA